jgi:hypothetical protein
MTRRVLYLICAAVVLASTPAMRAQQAPAAPPAGLPQRFPAIDLTGTWVSIVTEDWAVRMITPPKGDFESLPLTQAARDAANSFDLAQAESAGRACDAYGAPALLRQPGRIRLSWQDANTLRLEADAGEQTRVLAFAGSSASRGAPSRQGFSVAEWQYAGGFNAIRAADPAAAAGRGGRGGGGGRGGRGGGRGTMPTGGKLKVTTSNLTPGLLRKNGVPYSANATMTEYFNEVTEQNGTRWLIVTTVVHDPVNLAVDYITSTNFRKEPDDAKWAPTPCSLR